VWPVTHRLAREPTGRVQSTGSNVGGPVIPPTCHIAHHCKELHQISPKSDYSADMGLSLFSKAMSAMSAIWGATTVRAPSCAVIPFETSRARRQFRQEDKRHRET
jgi:hypothetical protein